MKKDKIKKILLSVLIYFIICSVITVGGLIYVERFLYSFRNTDINNVNAVTNVEDKNILKLPYDDLEIQYSTNNKYYAFLKDNVIQIYSLDKNEVYATIEESDTICHYDLQYDKNSIVYFTQSTNNSTSHITIKNFDIQTKRKTEFVDFNIQNFVQVKNWATSPVINNVFFTIETKSGNSTINTMYRVNVFNNMSKQVTGKIIEKLVAMKYTDKIYYEDKDGNQWSNVYGKMSIFKGKVELIGSDFDDRVYYMNKDKNKVYIVFNNKIQKTIELQDTEWVSYYANGYKAFLIYKNYMLELSGKDPHLKVAEFPDNYKFEAVKDTTSYFKTSSNSVIRIDMKDKVISNMQSGVNDESIDANDPYSNTNTNTNNNTNNNNVTNNNTNKNSGNSQEKKENNTNTKPQDNTNTKPEEPNANA